MTEPFLHRPVMADEVVELFRPVPAGILVDATVGGGGHARRLLEARPDLRILGLDRDPAALAAAAAHLAPFGDRVTLVRSRFDHLGQIMSDLAIDDISGVLFDLGVSSPQLDEPERGFSYRGDGPIDMRMDPDDPWSAADVVNGYQEAELAHVLAAYGDERYARRIAHAIVEARPVETTAELAGIVAGAIPAAARRRGGHPAKRTFQAIRIEVNRELDVLPGALDRAIERDPGGRSGRRPGLPLRRGSHRQGPVPPRRHRWLHLPTRLALRVRRGGDRPPGALRRHEADCGRGGREPPGRFRPPASRGEAGIRPVSPVSVQRPPTAPTKATASAHVTASAMSRLRRPGLGDRRARPPPLAPAPASAPRLDRSVHRDATAPQLRPIDPALHPLTVPDRDGEADPAAAATARAAPPGRGGAVAPAAVHRGPGRCAVRRDLRGAARPDRGAGHAGPEPAAARRGEP